MATVTMFAISWSSSNSLPSTPRTRCVVIPSRRGLFSLRWSAYLPTRNVAAYLSVGPVPPPVDFFPASVFNTLLLPLPLNQPVTESLASLTVEHPATVNNSTTSATRRDNNKFIDSPQDFSNVFNRARSQLQFRRKCAPIRSFALEHPTGGRFG